MPRRNAIDVIAPAWEHMKQLLFPVRWAVWWRVGLLGLATGELSSGGGYNGFNYQVPASHASHDHVALFAGVPPVWVIALIALGVTLLLVLMVVFVYVSSVCRFILFESVLTRRFALREGWHKWQRQGMRYFGFNLLVMVASLIALAVILAPAILFAYRRVGGNPGGHLLLLIGGGALLLTILMIVFVAISVVYVLVKDFVIPQMALEDVSVVGGWQRLWAQMTQERGAYAGYIGMKIVLALGAALALGIVMLVIVFILLIPGIIIAVLVAALKPGFGAALVLSIVIPLGIVVVLGLIFAMAVLGSPITIFFPAYSMHFFAGRYPPLAALLYPPPAPPAAAIPPAGPDLAPAT